MRLSLKLLVLGVAFALFTCSVGATESCFKPEGSDIKFDSTCAKGDVKFERGEQSFSVQFSAPGFNDTNGKRFELIVGGCKLGGSIRWDTLSSKPALMIGFENEDGSIRSSDHSPTATLTAKPDGLSFAFESGPSLTSIPCNASFESKDGGKFSSSFGIEIPKDGIKELNVVIKDAGLESSSAKAGNKLPWWVPVLIAVGVIFVAVVFGIIGWCVYRRNKQKAKAKADVEAQAKNDADKPKEEKPETEVKQSTGTEDSKPTTADKIGTEASQTTVKKDDQSTKVGQSTKLAKKDEQSTKLEKKDETSAKPKKKEERAKFRPDDDSKPKQKEVAKRQSESKQPVKSSQKNGIKPKGAVHKSSAGVPSVETAEAPTSMPKVDADGRHRYQNLPTLAAASMFDVTYELQRHPLSQAHLFEFRKLFDEQHAVLGQMLESLPEIDLSVLEQKMLVYKLNTIIGREKKPGDLF